MTNLSLLPPPRTLDALPGQCLIAPGRRIVLQGAPPQALLFAARRLQSALRERAGVAWELAASPSGPPEEIGAVLRVVPGWAGHPQGYHLTLGPQGIAAEAGTSAGILYAVCTLAQIIEQAGARLPALQIDDAPAFGARGVMLDISRDKVPTMDTLLAIVDMLAGWKINQLQLYTEHTFAYRAHPQVWADASPLTGEEIIALDAYCRERQIELVPNQNSFGHMHRWLRHPRYAALAEVADGFTTPWGQRSGPFSLAPVEPGSLDLLRGLYDELLPHFSSRMFNVGCDETFDLGQGRSKDACERRGLGRVYLDFLRQIHAEVAARGRTMQFWGDIIVQHPQLIPELPADAIALEWGYEAGHPFDTQCPLYASAGLPFYVCPGTSSWCSLAGRSDNALGNLRSAAEHGQRHGAQGYLITDWGDLGHWQALPVSFLGLAMGAAYAWSPSGAARLDATRAASLHAFRDPTGASGLAAYTLGNLYQGLGPEIPNGSLLFWVLQRPLGALRSGASAALQELMPTDLERASERIEVAAHLFGQARMARPDAGLIAAEYELTARLMRHACRRAALALGADVQPEALDRDMQAIIAEYRRLWLARNRPGGLADSAARLELARADYRG